MRARGPPGPRSRVRVCAPVEPMALPLWVLLAEPSVSCCLRSQGVTGVAFFSETGLPSRRRTEGGPGRWAVCQSTQARGPAGLPEAVAASPLLLLPQACARATCSQAGGVDPAVLLDVHLFPVQPVGGGAELVPVSYLKSSCPCGVGISTCVAVAAVPAQRQIQLLVSAAAAAASPGHCPLHGSPLWGTHYGQGWGAAGGGSWAWRQWFCQAVPVRVALGVPVRCLMLVRVQVGPLRVCLARGAQAGLKAGPQ